MARILIEIEDHFPLEAMSDENRESICRSLHEEFKSEIERELSVKDAYIIEFNEGDEEEYLLGALEPEKLLDEVRQWNRRIINGFADAVAPMSKRASALSMPLHDALRLNNDTNVLRPDTTETYAVRQYASAVDNHFTTFFDYMNFLPNEQGYPYARTLLREWELRQIEAKPERYVIVDFCVR